MSDRILRLNLKSYEATVVDLGTIRASVDDDGTWFWSARTIYKREHNIRCESGRAPSADEATKAAMAFLEEEKLHDEAG